jgi:hypothetical protein
VTLQASRNVPAVLDGEHALLVEATSLRHQRLVATRASADGTLASNLAGHPVDPDGGVGLLVWIDPDYDHSWSPFGREHRMAGPPADTPQWGGCTLL